MDPETRTRLDRFRGVVTSEDEQKLLDLIFFQSPYLAEFLIRDPSQLQQLDVRHEKSRAHMRAEIDHLVRYRNREYLRIGARELLGHPTGAELSHLAETCLDFAIAQQQPAGRFVVMGMGKLGGEELNFSSDIDLVYISEDDDCTKLAERVTRAVNEVTDEGRAFRVDLRLRPQGTRGPLVSSLAALERYYESFGRPWERQAWLKARPVAGDLALGEEALKILEPFIWPRTTSDDVIDSVKQLMARVRGDENDLKLGPGGIREIEFFVQALQLVHGRDRTLRERGTLRALDKLQFAGLISDKEQRALAEAYVFLRRVEHRLQLDRGLQTHSLPRDRNLLALRLGFSDERAFEISLETHRRHVSEIYATLGEAHVADVAPLLDPLATRESLQGVFTNTDDLERLRDLPHSPFSHASPLAISLLHEITRSPDPDLALRRLVDLVRRRREGAGIWRLLESPPLAHLLALLFGSSEFLGKLLVAHPELLGELHAPPPPLPDDPEDRLNALRRIKNEELLRIGLLDLGGELDVDALSHRLSDLADRLLAALAPPSLAVMALGRLGARELSYASDLDLIFFYEGDFEPHARLAQRFVQALSAHLEEGRLYAVDTRLRPSGQQGTLVSSLEGFRDYHARHARLWERQALLRLRFVAGHRALGELVEREAAEFAFSGPVDAGEIARMRVRLEEEARETPHRFNLKSGRGGLTDIDFLTQYLQLRDRLPARGTAEALRLLHIPEAADLLESQRFLRRLENRLRIAQDRPLDELGEDDRLARRLGYHGDSPGARLLTDYRAHTDRVRDAYLRYLP